MSPDVKQIEYRLNGGHWKVAGNGEPRAPNSQFVTELYADELQVGANQVELRVAKSQPQNIIKKIFFAYNPAEIQLPIEIDWQQANDLEVEDGFWETFQSPEGDYRVRPKPGHEGWDRVLVVAGTFAAGRRVETELIYRHKTSKDRKYGFGIFPLWGGRPDRPGYSPRRGWNFSLVWFFGRYGGVGNEFSYKFGPDEPVWVSSYRNFDMKPDRKYRIVAEVWPEMDQNGKHLSYHQRMKWWEAGTDEPEAWVELTDREGAPIPAAEYGVAFITYYSQVEFGPVSITALPEKPSGSGHPAESGHTSSTDPQPPTAGQAMMPLHAYAGLPVPPFLAAIETLSSSPALPQNERAIMLTQPFRDVVPVEFTYRPAAGGRSHVTPQLRIDQKALKRKGQRIGIAPLDQQTGLSIVDRFRKGARMGGNDRQAAGHGLHHRHPERFVPD